MKKRACIEKAGYVEKNYGAKKCGFIEKSGTGVGRDPVAPGVPAIGGGSSN